MAKRKTTAKKDPNKLDLFKVMNGMSMNRYNNYKQTTYNEDQIKESGLGLYMLITFLSSDPRLLWVADEFNNKYKYYTDNFYQAYIFALLTMKELKADVRWLKRDKKITAKAEDIELIMRYFFVTEEVAGRYHEYFDKDDLEHFREIFYIPGTKVLNFKSKSK